MMIDIDFKIVTENKTDANGVCENDRISNYKNTTQVLTKELVP